jgi:hypothetical protein
MDEILPPSREAFQHNQPHAHRPRHSERSRPISSSAFAPAKASACVERNLSFSCLDLGAQRDSSPSRGLRAMKNPRRVAQTQNAKMNLGAATRRFCVWGFDFSSIIFRSFSSPASPIPWPFFQSCPPCNRGISQELTPPSNQPDKDNEKISRPYFSHCNCI